MELNNINNLQKKIKSGIQNVLNSVFQDFSKRVIKESSDKYNFACPYCGDSDVNKFKKRGNIYKDSLKFHCFNGGCNKHCDIFSFLKDFNINSTELFTQTDFQYIIENNQKHVKVKNGIELFEVFKKEKLFNKKDFIKKLNLENIKGSRVEKYLLNRYQLNFENFAWDDKKEQLYIFNTDISGEYFIGYQIRNFKGEVKYLTYKYEKVYLLAKDDLYSGEDVNELNKLSVLFNILKINYNDIVTVFEGPLDCFLYNNSVGLSSINNTFPFKELDKRHMFDNDETGIKKALELIKQGESVFLWGKFFNDFNIKNKKIKDLTDIVKYTKNNSNILSKIEDYFSNDAIDVLDIYV